MSKPITIAEFRKAHDKSGESVLDIAYDAQYVSDDEEFRLAATAAVQAEDKFLQLMNERDIQIG